ncbi:DUF3105 domain-containing protein [Streptomyces sp. S1D4-11]|nr:DUF3105 domain-containing protein [Streptomyces sp. S1D4-11]QIZ00736.1 DUF3105 domain-containing protein [Streptomyces sp. S1D4-11]
MASATSKSPNAGKGKNTSKAKAKAEARRARAEELRRARRARERGNRIITIGLSTAILAGLVGGGWYLIDYANKKEQELAAPIADVKTWSNLSRNHVTTKVDYPMTPPAGGDHLPIWQNCNGDVYTHQIQDGNAVHSLEHGAVWVTYNNKATDADVKALAAKARDTPHTLISPYPSQSSPITLNAWGHQLNLNKESDPRVNKFLDK